MFKILLPVLLVGSNAFASNLCFEAQDASKIKVVISNEIDNETTTEQLAKASLRIESNSEDSRAHMDVVTASGVKATSMSFYQSDRDVYQVECDGGNMRVEATTADSVLIDSKGFRADIDGCGASLMLTTPESESVEFLPVQCSAPKAN